MHLGHLTHFCSLPGLGGLLPWKIHRMLVLKKTFEIFQPNLLVACEETAQNAVNFPGMDRDALNGSQVWGYFNFAQPGIFPIYPTLVYTFLTPLRVTTRQGWQKRL